MWVRHGRADGGGGQPGAGVVLGHVCAQAASCGIQRFALLSRIFFMPQMLMRQQKPLSRASPHHGNGEEKEQRSGEVLLVTINHQGMADGSCEAGKAVTSLDSLSAGGAVIHR